ncbi:MAG: lysophospholipid acyltransferase family protein [Candidatus Krumholzibacteriota bacterium]|nr:lysophospholipid acyltransferase family protein [Candidatus Krumholzibacteriota bacterium]
MRLRLHPGAASVVGAAAVALLGATWRIEIRGLEREREARGLSGNVIYPFWHGRLLALSWTHRGRHVQVLASEHYDGDLMGRIIARLGFGHLKGSTTRGGARALRELAAAARDGLDLGLTVDGPRGPRGEVQQGVIELSRMTGAAVLPIADAARPRRLLGSWDRFQVPAPFARVIVDHGAPFVVPRDADAAERERLRRGLEETLAGMTAKLDRDLGYADGEVWPHADH